MSSESTTQSKQRLADLLETLDAAQNPEQEILRLLIARADEKDAELGKVIRYCAIPRRIDAEIIGVLRQAPNERETNERLLSKLVNFSFTRTRPDGGYTYEEGARNIILEDWRAADKRDQFDQLNQQLITFYKNQYDKIERLGNDLTLVAREMQSANPTRYVQLTSIFETRIVSPLLEILYHKSLQSAEACYKYFERLYQDQEKAGRLMARESLLNATRDYLERLPPDSGKEPWLKWLQYWKGRLKGEIRQDKRAEEILLDLLPQTEDDITLRLWTLGDIGLTYYNQSKLREANSYYQQALDLAKKTGVDAYNLPLWYFRVAQLHWSLEELDEAKEKYQEAIECAQGSNVGLEISARIDLSGVFFARGDWEDALNEIIETLHLARTQLPSDRATYRAVIQQFMNLLARRDPSLLDTIFLEAEASFADTNDPLAPLRFRYQYISLMRQSGQLRRADQQLAKLIDEVSKHENVLFVSDLLLEKALLSEEQGQLEEVVGVYDQLAELTAKQDGSAWHSAVAVSNRGMVKSKLALWKQSEADLREAIRKWHEMSHDKLEAFIQGALATTFRLQGRLPEAQESLDKALAVLKETGSGYLNDIYQEQGEIYQAQGRKEEARQQYQLALERYSRLDQFKQAARSLGSLTTLAADRGDWDEAAKRTAKSSELWRRLAEIDGYSPSAAAEHADEENANGMQAFFATDDDRLEKIRKARDLFRAASTAVPDNFWYQLNLAYACAELEEWPEAAEAVRSMLNRSPKWLRTRMLYKRLADYRANQGEKMFRAGQYAEAAKFYAESRVLLEGHVAFERLAEVDLRQGDSLLKLSVTDGVRLSEAKRAYENGLARVGEDNGSTSQTALFQATFHARLGFVNALQADLLKALDHFRSNIQLRAEAKQSNVVEDLVSLVGEFSDLITSVNQYRVLGEALRVLADDRLIDGAQRQRLIDAQFEFSRGRYQAMRRPSGEAARVATSPELLIIPIALDADDQLFPLNEETPEVKRMIEVDIPAMRQRMLYKPMGVNVPGVRIRAKDNFEEGRYELLLNEIPLDAGFVFAKEKFCPDAERCRELGEGHAALNPEDGKEGVWLPEPAWKKAQENGLTLIDSYEYMILHLGVLLRRNLASFVGVQETQTMLDEWVAEEEDRSALLKKAVPDDAALVRLSQVLQLLLKEEVPIKNLSNILTTFAEVNPTSPELIEVVESVRMALRADLPVNKGGRKLIRLSQDFEAAVERWVQQPDGKRFLAVPAVEAQKIINALQHHIGDAAADGLALIVNTHGLRPFVWRLVNGNYPSMLVSSLSELTEGMTLTDERIELANDDAG
jgi:tetratricopeptide (TPR) repeat protein